MIALYSGGIIFYGFTAFFDPLVVYLIDTTGRRTAVIILGAGMWIIGIPLTFIIRDNPEDCGLLPDGRKTEPPAAGAPGTTDGGISASRTP